MALKHGWRFERSQRNCRLRHPKFFFMTGKGSALKFPHFRHAMRGWHSQQVSLAEVTFVCHTELSLAHLAFQCSTHIILPLIQTHFVVLKFGCCNLAVWSSLLELVRRKLGILQACSMLGFASAAMDAIHCDHKRRLRGIASISRVPMFWPDNLFLF